MYNSLLSFCFQSKRMTLARVHKDILDLVRDNSFNGSVPTASIRMDSKLDRIFDYRSILFPSQFLLLSKMFIFVCPQCLNVCQNFDFSLLDYNAEKNEMQPVLLFDSMNHFSASECQVPYIKINLGKTTSKRRKFISLNIPSLKAFWFLFRIS